MGATAVSTEQCTTCHWPIYPFCICPELREARQSAIKDCIAAAVSIPKDTNGFVPWREHVVSKGQTHDALMLLLDDA